ncbi:MAG: 2-oxoacid:acceptor oxidoreductase family protein [Caulobacteraceae bacterium]|nr:2-oxoacid:acceptor oxidoreductase family protein [Caulobacteraceae bacterium]
MINQRVCEGCGDCGVKSNCLSVQPVETPFGRKTQIHQSSCNQDFSCVQGDCPSFLTVEASSRPTSKARPGAPLPLGFSPPDPVPITPQENFSACLTGIGGTGVVTVNQILGTAAFLCGFEVQTYDHTGSSQKAGPVVSHLKVSSEPLCAAPTVGAGHADLYLVFDPLVAVSPQNLAVASAERTVAVVSTTAVPTGEMVADKTKRFPSGERLRRKIDSVSRAEQNLYLDAQDLSDRLTGDPLASNLLLVGAAYQKGALPIPAGAIEEAIRLNGTAVDVNLHAFRWGRVLVAQPGELNAALRPGLDQFEPRPPLSAGARRLIDGVHPGDALREILEVRVPDLIAYQDEAYAARYVRSVAAVRAAEAALPVPRQALSLAAAKYLYKLMAIKDEYEVARLLLNDSEQARIRELFGDRPRVSWNLHPTFLRSLGLGRKVRLGPWFAPAMKLLRAAKVLRRTPLDIFGNTSIRRDEVRLLRQYEGLLTELQSSLTAENYDQVVRIAELPDMIRGYEDVKARNIESYDEALGRETSAIGLRLPLPTT